MRILTEAEIKDSITALHPLKAPGPDGFLAGTLLEDKSLPGFKNALEPVPSLKA